MATIQEVKAKNKAMQTQIENANALGREKLAEKGIELPESATTHEIMQSIEDVSKITVEYIESTGEQYIDTGYIANQNTRIECKYQIVGRKAGFDTLFSDFTNVQYTHIYNAKYQLVKWGGQYREFGSLLSSSDIITLSVNNGTFTFTENDTTTTQVIGADKEFTSPYSILLFCNRFYGDVSQYELASCCKARIYYFKIYEGENLVRDFVPATDEKGVICFYDNVTKAYFYNQGSGKFKTEFVTRDLTTTESLLFKQATNISFANNTYIKRIDVYIDKENQNFVGMFKGTTNLKFIVGVNTSKATNVKEMFSSSGIEEIQEPFDFSNITVSGNGMAFFCSLLREIRFVIETIKNHCNFQSCDRLSAESVNSIINGLATITNVETVVFHSAISVTDEQKAIINNKGWTLVFK